MKTPAKIAPKSRFQARQSPKFFSATIIASAARCCTKTIHRRAARDGWPRSARDNYAVEFTPPAKLRSRCLAIFQRTKPTGLKAISIGLERRAEIDRALHRFSSLLALEAELIAAVPFEVALKRISTACHTNPNSLRRWAASFLKRGIAGLLENKRGHSGRKPK